MSASVLTSETMIKSNIDLKEAISGWVCFKKYNPRRLKSGLDLKHIICLFISYCNHKKIQLQPQQHCNGPI